jgi:hypothetical protein
MLGQRHSEQIEEMLVVVGTSPETSPLGALQTFPSRIVWADKEPLASFVFFAFAPFHIRGFCAVGTLAM